MGSTFSWQRGIPESMSKRHLVMVLAVLSCPLLLTAQPVPQGTAGWKKLDSEHYEIIFPAFLEEDARYSAAILEHLWPFQQSALQPSRNYRFPVLLNPFTAHANGSVSLLPRRATFFTSPGVSFGSDWLTLLAIHEGRHMFQIDSLNRNTTRALYFLNGEIGFLPLMPLWWLEGDAVMAETIYTSGGRGRDPDFTKLFKAIVLENKEWSYNKFLLGSFRDEVPDAYTFGYVMQAWMRSEYSPEAPKTLLNAWTQTPVPAWGPYRAMKAVTGKGGKNSLREMTAWYRAFWERQQLTLPVTPVRWIVPPREQTFREITHLNRIDDGSLIYHTRTDGISEIVRHSNGETRLLARARPASALSAAGSLIAWDEFQFDTVFASSTTRIIVRDTRTGRTRVLANGGNLDHPALSPDGTVIAVRARSPEGEYSILLLSLADFSEVSRFTCEPGTILADFRFGADSRTLIGILYPYSFRAQWQGSRLVTLDMDTGTLRVMMQSQEERISSPVADSNSIVFSSTWSGIETLWRMNEGSAPEQLFGRPYSARYPTPDPDSGNLYFVDFSGSTGDSIAVVNSDDIVPISRSNVPIVREDFYHTAHTQEGPATEINPSLIAKFEGPVRDWTAELDGNRPTRWGIAVDELTRSRIGLTLGIDNLAGVLSHDFLSLWDVRTSTVTGSWTTRWSRYRPRLTLSALFSGAPDNIAQDNSAQFTAGVELPFGVERPGTWSFHTLLALSTGSRFTGSEAEALVLAQISQQWYHPLTSVAVLGALTADPAKARDTAHLWSSVRSSLRGPLRRDSIGFYAASEFAPDDAQPVMTGYYKGSDGMSGKGRVSAGLSWNLPLVYPDAALGSLVYFNKIAAEVFYDANSILESGETLKAVGLDLISHFMPLQLPFEIQAGIRYAWLFEQNGFTVTALVMGIQL